MIVTEQWIRDHSTSDKVGSWTNKQFEILGVQKKKGWMDIVCGYSITEAKRIEFESYGYDKVGSYNKDLF